MIKAFKILSLIILFLSLNSCGKTSLDKSEYTRFVESVDHGLKKKIIINDWEYVLQFRPHNYILCQENQLPGSKRATSLLGTCWFSLRFKFSKSSVPPLKLNVNSMSDYTERLDYYLNKAKQDFVLEYGDHTIYPSSYLFESTYGLTPDETMNIGFNLPANESDIKQDLVLKFHDRVFRNGIIKFRISADDVKKLPQLNFK